MKRNKKITVLALLLIVAAAIGIGAYIKSRPQNDELSLKWGGPKNIAMLPLIAENQDYFTANGINAKRIDVVTGKQAMDALTSGSIDLAVLVDTNIAFAGFSKSSDVVVVAEIMQKTDDSLVVRSSAINDVQDLKGKTVGVTVGTTSHAYTLAYLKKNGVSPSEVNIRNMPPPAIQASLLNGQIDAGALWQPWRYNVVNKNPSNYSDWNDTNAYTAYAVIAVRKSYLKNNKAAVEAFLKALKQADNFVKSSKDKAQTILAKEISIPLPIYKAIWSEYSLGVSLTDGFLNTLNNEGEWIRTTQKGHIGKSQPDYSKMIDSSVLEAIKPE